MAAGECLPAATAASTRGVPTATSTGQANTVTMFRDLSRRALRVSVWVASVLLIIAASFAFLGWVNGRPPQRSPTRRRDGPVASDP
jgi:hypothetical protein